MCWLLRAGCGSDASVSDVQEGDVCDQAADTHRAGARLASHPFEWLAHHNATHISAANLGAIKERLPVDNMLLDSEDR